MKRRLETPEELASGMNDRTPADALLYFVDWLNRRDRVSDKIATDHLAASLRLSPQNFVLKPSRT